MRLFKFCKSLLSLLDRCVKWQAGVRGRRKQTSSCGHPAGSQTPYHSAVSRTRQEAPGGYLEEVAFQRPLWASQHGPE